MSAQQADRVGKVTCTAYIDKSVKQALKAALAQSGRTIQQAIEEMCAREIMRPNIVDFDPRVEELAKIFDEDNWMKIAVDMQVDLEVKR